MVTPNTSVDFSALPVRQLVQLVQNGEINAVTIAQHYAKQIQQYESQYHTFAYYNESQLINQAMQFDNEYSKLTNEQRRLYTLAGIPVGVKDIINTHDMPTTYGSKIYDMNQPNQDAVVIQMVKHCGGLIAGKTHTTEFAFYDPSVTLNPRDIKRTPGGSSSGSSASVAANMLPVAFGTQTVGSIVRPASFTGIAGYKPTYNTLCTQGVNALSWSLDTVGSLGRTVDDAVYLVGALTNRTNELIGKWTHKHQPNIALCKTHEWNTGHTDQLDYIWQELESALKYSNTPVQHIDLPIEFSQLSTSLNTILSYEAALFHTLHYKLHKARMSSKLLELIETGQTISVDQVNQAKLHIRHCNILLEQLKHSNKFDVLIVPSAQGIAPLLVDGNTGNPIFNRCWTALGVPLVGVAGLVSEHEKLPIGVTVVGTLYSDSVTVQAAGYIEQVIAKYMSK